MADLKISQLTLATLPLAGTEVLPIVQSSSTKKVATDDLTVKNVRSNATTGILQIAGPAAAATRTMTVPDANFTVARTDAGQSFTGDQTLSTGNLVIGTAGKGIDFSATPGTGTSELFADYEEGTWTVQFYDAATAGNVSATTATGYYTRIGNLVHCSFFADNIDTTGMTAGNAFNITLPFTSNASLGRATGSVILNEVVYAAGRTQQNVYVAPNSARATIQESGSNVARVTLTVGAFTSGSDDIFAFNAIYYV